MAAKLRENLRRRKVQARALEAGEGAGEGFGEGATGRAPLSNTGDGG